MVPAPGSKSVSGSPEVPAGNGSGKVSTRRHSQLWGNDQLTCPCGLAAIKTRNATTAQLPSRLLIYPMVRDITYCWLSGRSANCAVALPLASVVTCTIQRGGLEEISCGLLQYPDFSSNGSPR